MRKGIPDTLYTMVPAGQFCCIAPLSLCWCLMSGWWLQPRSLATADTPASGPQSLVTNQRPAQRLGDQSEAGLRVASEYRGRQWQCCDQALALTHSDEEYTNKSLSCFWCCLKCKFTVLLHLGEILILISTINQPTSSAWSWLKHWFECSRLLTAFFVNQL